MSSHAAPRPRFGGIAWTSRWRPAVLGPVDIMLSAYAMAVMALVRGLDYGLGDDAAAKALTVVEAAAPLAGWAAGFTLGGAVLALGAVRRWHGVVWTGHAILAVLYAALAVGILWAAIGNPWLDGIRAATVLILPTAMHWTLGLRTGPRPIERGQARASIVTETTEG